MTLSFMTRLLVVWLCGAGGVLFGCVSSSKVWLDDHGRYQNIVVGVHPGLTSYNCTELFTNLQAVASRFSAGLQTATSARVAIGRLQVVLPQSMAHTCHLSHLPYATWQRWSQADIRLVPGSNVIERWAPEGSVGVGVRQVEGCSKPGDYITLNAATLVETRHDYPVEGHRGQDTFELLGRSLVAGWARYRWGVYEERGYEGDSRYPPPMPCPPDSLENCTETPVVSLMQKVSPQHSVKFCDVETHDYETPTPQNLACAGRSVFEVISLHYDFDGRGSNRGKRWRDEVEVVRPHSGGRVMDHHSFHVEGDIDRYLESKDVNKQQATGQDGIILNQSREINEKLPVSSELTAEPRLNGTVLADAADIVLINTTSNYSNPVRVSWQHGRSERSLPQSEFQQGNVDSSEIPLNISHQSPNATKVLPSSIPEILGLVAADDPTAIAESDATERSLVKSELDNTSSERSTEKAISLQENEFLEKSTTVQPPQHRPVSLSLSIRPEAQGFNSVPLELMIAPPPIIVVALDLSQTAIDEVGVETLRGALLRWMWGLGGGSRLSILAAYNNESFPLTLSPLPPSPRSAAQLEARLALLPTKHEAATGVYGGQYCLACVLQQAAELVTKGGANVESALLVVAACRPAVGLQERRILESSGLLLHTIALCSTAVPEFDQLASRHSSWVLPTNAGPEDGERQLARILQAIVHESASTPQDSELLQLHEKGRYVKQSELESSGAYALVGGKIHLGTSSSKRLLVLSTTSPAKVVEMRDRDGRRLEIVRDTGRRFWLEVSTSGAISYTFKFLSTSLSFPLHISEDIYEQRTGLSGIKVHLRTSNEGHAPLVPESPPVVVWADVTLDGWPVLGATVTLMVTHLPSGIASNYSLLDNGSTEPDIRADDGVYARYLTWRLGEGRYSLLVLAVTGGSAEVVTALADGSLQRTPPGLFRVASAARTLYVRRVSFADTAPPSRVTDLAAHLVDGGPLALVNLSWTAPGGELDQGAASRYELKMYTERLALTQGRFNDSGIDVFCLVGGMRSLPPPPALHGTPQHCQARVPFTDLKWYFAIRGVDGANNTGQVSNIVWIIVPKPPPTTSASTVHSISLTTPLNESITYRNMSSVSTFAGTGWRPYVVAGTAVLGLLMVGAAAAACVCCCRKAKARKEKDTDRPVYKIYVNNAYIQEEDGEIKVVQEWVNSLDKFGNVESAEATVEGTELKNKASFKYTSPVRFGVLTNGSIMRDATTVSNSSGSSSRPSNEAQQEDYKYRDLSESTSDTTTDGLLPSSSSSAATDVAPLPQVESKSANVPPTYPSPSKSASFKNTNISSLPLPSPRKTHTPIPSAQNTQLSLHVPLSVNDYTSEEEGGFRPRAKQISSRGSPLPGRRQIPQHFSSFRYLPPPPQYRSNDPVPYQFQYPQLHQAPSQQPSPASKPMARVNGSLSHGTVRSVKKRRHISFV